MNLVERIKFHHLIEFLACRSPEAPQRYAALSETDRGDIARYAAGIGIELPVSVEDQPSELQPALTRLGQWEPAGGRVNPDELAELYRQLTIQEGHRFAEDMIRIWGTHWEAYDDPEGPLMYLACLVPGALRGCHERIIEAGLARGFYPGELYRDADSASRDQLFWILEAPPHDRAVLKALVWIGDEVVQAALHHWSVSPQPWYAELATGLGDRYFTRDAGWELTENGSRRDLYHQQCYRLVPRRRAARVADSGPVEVVSRHEERCGWCKLQLATLFDIDLQDERLAFLAPGWQRLRIAMCNRCKVDAPLFTEVDGEGHSHWSDFNGHPRNLNLQRRGWRFPQRRLVMGPARGSPYEAHFGILYHGSSQIGGFPMWEHDISHPRCPKCERWMVFVGQVMTGDALDYGEGTTYALLCQECGLAATAYEQT